MFMSASHQLVEVNERPKMKISEDPKKTTVPGRKDIYRLADSEGEQSRHQGSTRDTYTMLHIIDIIDKIISYKLRFSLCCMSLILLSLT